MASFCIEKRLNKMSLFNELHINYKARRAGAVGIEPTSLVLETIILTAELYSLSV